MQVDDTDLRTFVRSHLVRHRIDMTGLQLRVFNGTVRMAGQIRHLGQQQPVTLSTLESLEREILATTGVRHVFFEFENFQRLVTGEWQEVRAGKPGPVQETEIQTSHDVMFEERTRRAAEPQPLKASIPMEELLLVRPNRRVA